MFSECMENNDEGQMSNSEIVLKKISESLIDQSLSIPEQAIAVEINNQNEFDRASELYLTIKALKQSVEDTFSPIISMAHLTHKNAINEKKKAEAPLLQAEMVLKPKIFAYQQKVQSELKASQASQFTQTGVLVAATSDDATVLKSRDVFKFEVQDFNALPDKYKKPDEVAIGKIVRALGINSNIPGVRVWVEKSLY